MIFQIFKQVIFTNIRNNITAQLVECLTTNLKITSSNPILRKAFYSSFTYCLVASNSFLSLQAWYQKYKSQKCLNTVLHFNYWESIVLVQSHHSSQVGYTSFHLDTEVKQHRAGANRDWWIEVGRENSQGVYLSFDDRAKLKHSCTMHTAYIGSLVGGSVCLIHF